ncbi:MAG: hybrid sensor histidine kinase/response regulator, partial [Gemmatimonadota bacterium]
IPQGTPGRDLFELREAELGQVRLQQARTFRFLYAGGAGAALLLVLSSLFWGRFLQRRLARPLAQLGAAAERIGAGDLSVRVPVPTESELAAVASSFNQMADGLVTARIDLEHRNQQLEQAVSRLRDTQAELVQTEKLSAVGRMMAGLAHELNNPLASVLGYGQLLAERVERGGRVPADELRDGYVGPIVAEAGRARELVQNLLRFSRKSAASLSAVSLGAAVQVVVGIREYVFAQSGAELRVDPVPDVWLLADEQRLQQVLLNVVNNAFDAVRGRVPGPGRVHVRFERRAGLVDVIVEDDGPGFADPDPVFEPFYTTKAVGEGTGLGLTIVHQFMEEVDGAVRVENRTEGGARVVLTFRETVPPAPEPAPEQESTPAPLRSLRVLIVEDELPLRNLQQRILESQGAKVQLAAGGREARLILETADPDLVISDVKMPDGGGLDLYRWIEAERPELARRFLFVTGDVGDPAIAALAEAKPGQFISKPFDRDEYLARIAALAGEVTMSETG